MDISKKINKRFNTSIQWIHYEVMKQICVKQYNACVAQKLKLKGVITKWSKHHVYKRCNTVIIKCSKLFRRTCKYSIEYGFSFL